MNNHNQKNVLVALSGGVDSAASVHILKERGYYVEGAVIEFSPAHKSAVDAAEQAAEQLGIRLHIIKCHDDFNKNVIEPFCKSYMSGQTPNPCIICNPTTKFKLICDKAISLGFEMIATGHYASTEIDSNGLVYLKKAGCIARDQSYMLYRLNQKQLKMLLLPLNSLEKSKVREIAANAGLSCANKPDSQEICFIPDNDYAKYIEEHYGKSEPGEFISPDGIPCGNHKGILHYTVGQRKHLGIALGYPVFIKSIDVQSNKIYLARSGEEYANGVELYDCVYIPEMRTAGDKFECKVKIRSRASEVDASVHVLNNNRAFVQFKNPERAPAPGQSCVFYKDDFIIGGGFIKNQI